MLQKPMQKRHDLQRHGAPPVAALFFILEKDASILAFDDAAVGDGDFKDVWSQVLDALCTGTDHPTVDHPGLLPDVWADAGSKPIFLHCIPELGLEDFGHGPHRQEKMIERAMPAAVRFGQCAGGYHIVDMGMVGHGAPPGVQHPEKSRQVRAYEPVVSCKRL